MLLRSLALDKSIHAAQKKNPTILTCVFAASLFMIHDSIRSCHNKMTELTGRQQICRQLLNASKRHIKTWRNHTTLVDATNELDNDLARAMVIYNLHIADIS